MMYTGFIQEIDNNIVFMRMQSSDFTEPEVIFNFRLVGLMILIRLRKVLLSNMIQIKIQSGLVKIDLTMLTKLLWSLMYELYEKN